MISFTKATIRAWWAPEHRLSCGARRWRRIVAELERRGEGRHEAGVFLLGRHEDNRRVVTDVVFYDQLDASAYASGVCVLHGNAFAKLWDLCRQRNVTVVADVHTHRGRGAQSMSDRKNPMVARAGHIAIILPNFARWPIDQRELGIFEYVGSHEWIDRGPLSSPGFFYTGFWSRQ